MKRKVIIVIYVILILILISFIYNYIVNSIFISKYNNNENYTKMLILGGVPQRYIANYNYGNILYKNEKYQEAIEEYKKALNIRVSKKNECSIRINYALAICKTVQVNESENQSIENAIKTYESAIDVLTQNGCANKNNDNGHSKEAEQLKKDIQEEIERLRNLKNTDEADSENSKDNEQDNNKKEPETIESKIQGIKENAIQDQRETESKYKNYGNYNYTRIERNW